MSELLLIIFGLTFVIICFIFVFDLKMDFKSPQINNHVNNISTNPEYDAKLLEDIPRTEFVKFIINYLKVNSIETVLNVLHSNLHYNSTLIKLTDNNGFFLCPGFVHHKNDSILILADYTKSYTGIYYMKKEIPYEITHEERQTLKTLIEDSEGRALIAKKNQELLSLKKVQRETEENLYKELANNHNIIILSNDEIKELEELEIQNQELSKLS